LEKKLRIVTARSPEVVALLQSKRELLTQIHSIHQESEKLLHDGLALYVNQLTLERPTNPNMLHFRGECLSRLLSVSRASQCLDWEEELELHETWKRFLKPHPLASVSTLGEIGSFLHPKTDVILFVNLEDIAHDGSLGRLFDALIDALIELNAAQFKQLEQDYGFRVKSDLTSLWWTHYGSEELLWSGGWQVFAAGNFDSSRIVMRLSQEDDWWIVPIGKGFSVWMDPGYELPAFAFPDVGIFCGASDVSELLAPLVQGGYVSQKDTSVFVDRLSRLINDSDNNDHVRTYFEKHGAELKTEALSLGIQSWGIDPHFVDDFHRVSIGQPAIVGAFDVNLKEDYASTNDEDVADGAKGHLKLRQGPVPQLELAISWKPEGVGYSVHHDAMKSYQGISEWSPTDSDGPALRAWATFMKHWQFSFDDGTSTITVLFDEALIAELIRELQGRKEE